MWELKTFDGRVLMSGGKEVTAKALQAVCGDALRFRELPGNIRKTQVYLKAVLKDAERTIDAKTVLLVPDRDAELEQADIAWDLERRGDTVRLRLKSSTYARFVEVASRDAAGNYSDNFFHLEKGEERQITFQTMPGKTTDEIRQGITVRSMTDVEALGGPKDWKREWRGIFRKKEHVLSYILFKLLF